MRSDVNNGIAVHVAKNEHSFNWGNARVMRSVRGFGEGELPKSSDLDAVHELGQYDPPPSHLEPHLGPNLELVISNNACIQFYFNFFHLYLYL